MHWHVERQRKLIKRASRYAIDGPFVFLQLLERNPDRLRKLCLRQARFQPPRAQPRSNVAINSIRGPTAFICKRAAMAGKDRHMEAFTLTAVSGQARPSRNLAAAPDLMRAAHV